MFYISSLNKRLNYIDILKAIAIILVILGHANNFNANIKVYIYAFHMPLFFICTGITSKKRDYSTEKIGKIILKKFIYLFIPYIVWGLIFSKWELKSIISLLYGGYGYLSMTTLSSLWFLPCMIIASILFELLEYIFTKLNINSKIELVLLAIITFILIAVSYFLPTFSDYGYPMCFNISLMALAFLIIGNFIRKISDKINLINCKLYKLIISFLILFTISTLSVLNTKNIDYVLMADSRYGNIFLFIIFAIISSLAFYVISIILDRTIKENIIKNILIYIGQNTLIIFVTHKSIVNFLTDKFININITSSVCLVIITILTLTITCLLSIPINKFLPILNGKSKKKHKV